MAFTVSDAQDLVRLLRDHPEWRDDVRREILGPDYLPLPQLVRENAEAIRDLTVVADKNSVDIAALGVLVDKNREDIASLGVLVDKNREDIAALTADVRAMQADMVEFRVRMDEFSVRMDEHQSHIEGMLGKLPRMEAGLKSLRGRDLERWHREHPTAIATGALRRIRVLNPYDVLDDAYEAGRISEDDWRSVGRLDLLIGGREGSGDAARDAMLAIEISWTVDENDVRRAKERAAILERAGFRTRPVVVGRQATAPIVAFAAQEGVELRVDTTVDNLAS